MPFEMREVDTIVHSNSSVIEIIIISNIHLGIEQEGLHDTIIIR